MAPGPRFLSAKIVSQFFLVFELFLWKIHILFRRFFQMRILYVITTPPPKKKAIFIFNHQHFINVWFYDIMLILNYCIIIGYDNIILWYYYLCKLWLFFLFFLEQLAQFFTKSVYNSQCSSARCLLPMDCNN